MFSYFATLSGLPAAIVAWIEAMGLPPLGVIAADAFLSGSWFDIRHDSSDGSNLTLRLSGNWADDPIWWGVINIVVIELGMITPPIGIKSLYYTVWLGSYH